VTSRSALQRQTAATGVLIVAVLLGACRAQPGPERVRGNVIAVQASSLARADAITIRTDDGRELTFRVDPGVDMTPGHLREHMTLGEPVVVGYTRAPDGSAVAVRIEDG
jgi:hypothetical protein